MISKPTPQTPTSASLVLYGFLAGIGWGIFWGESAEPLGIVGEVFIDLLQMTVLPFITASLILNIGRLTPQACKKLGAVAVAVLFTFWCIAAVLLIVLPGCFPEEKQGAFFSTTMLQSPPAIDFIKLFVPSNPFHSLSNNVVPAVVLFCVFLGIAIIGMPEKEWFLKDLAFLTKALTRVNLFIARLTPLGVFGITAKTAGSVTIEEFSRLNVYLTTYTIGASVAAFVLLPGMVAVLTPFSFRDVHRVSRGALLTAFATGKVFIVLPLIIESASALLKTLDDFEEHHAPEALVPLAYPFPHLGKLLGLLFIPFAGWFVGSPVGWDDYPTFLGVGFISFFGSPLAAIPFLLDLFQLPADMFQMFIISGVYCSRLGDVVGVMHLLCFTVLSGYYLHTNGRLPVARIAFSTLTVGSLLLVVVAGAQLGLNRVVSHGPSRAAYVRSMHSAIHPDDSVIVEADASSDDRANESTLSRIQRRGRIRVGFREDELPFSFFNSNEELVGFDVDMAHVLADEMQVELEFVSVTNQNLTDRLNAGVCDVVMSGLPLTTSLLQKVRFSDPYLDVHLAFLVRDHVSDSFDSWDEMRDNGDLRIAVESSEYFERKLRQELPKAEIVSVPTRESFFRPSERIAEALLCSAEAGSAWSLLHPHFEVVIPRGAKVSVPLGYAVASGETEFAYFLSHWIALKQRAGLQQTLYDYWILGKKEQAKRPRWSVAKDVLGWN